MPADIDIEHPPALIAYLRRTGRIGEAESPRISVLAGGVSNRTVLVEREVGPWWVMKQALAKLRVEVDWFSDPARIEREAMGLIHLNRLAPGATPRLVFQDPEQSLLAMEAVPAPHENWKQMLLAGRVAPELAGQFGRLLGRIHRRSHERRGALADLFADRQFFQSLRIEPYYAYVADRDESAGAFLRALIADTRARTLALVHGDYSPKNVLVRNGGMILLDHEVIHWGDPAFDVGFALAHLLSKARHLPAHRAALTAAAGRFWGDYQQELGPIAWAGDLGRFAVRHTLGCLLARAVGRSPLEYLDASERSAQRDVAVGLMQANAASIDHVIESFLPE